MEDKKHLKHVKEHAIYCLNNTKKALNNWDFELFSFDTESCTKYRGCNKSAKVYSWSLGCVGSDFQVYGLNLNHFFKFMYYLTDYHFNNVFDRNKVKKNKDLLIKIPVAVHNLGWDLEFLKYHLVNEMNYNYEMATIETILRPTPHQVASYNNSEKTFHIVQNENVVYSLEVTLPNRHKVVRRGGKEFKVTYVLDFWDSFKVMSCSIDNITSFCKIDKMFDKLSDSYDYESFREKGQKPTDTELRYLYNDVYRLNKALEQFYLPICKDYNLENKRTASSIAFEILKQKTFTSSDNYNKEYREYFELDKFTTFEMSRKELEKNSYQGGYTHANHNHIDELVIGEGCSFDINSSYPSQMAYKLLPYGKPTKILNGRLVDFDNKNTVAIIEIGFDFVKPKSKHFDLPVFKIGGINTRSLRRIYGDVSGNEYFSTNIYKGEVIEVFKTISDTMESNYQLCVTSQEYEFFIKHFDFGHFTEEREMEWGGLEIGRNILYKAEVGKVNNFVQFFTKMKIAYKGRSKEQVKQDLKIDKDYYRGLLSDEELQKALKEGIKKDPVKVAFAKLELNSSYGKFGTKTLRNEVNLITDKDGIIRNATLRDGEEIFEYESQEFYRPFASFVTSYGRLQLWNTIIYAIGVENFLYCDTDSIYCRGTKGEMAKRMNDIGETIDPTILGKWDCETEFKAFKMLGQKKYMLQLNNGKFKLRCCGLPKNAQYLLCNQGFKNFYLGVEVEGKKQRMRVIGGALLLNVKYKIQKIMFS